MQAQILGHTASHKTNGYYVGIVYSHDEALELIEAGIEDFREVVVSDVKERAERFCRLWNYMYGNDKNLNMG